MSMQQHADDRERYRRARELFHAACELVPEARARYLDEACADDLDIRGEVETLFALERCDLVDVLAVHPAADDRPPAPAAAQLRIGRYQLHRLIGEGGFGSVFLAEQTEPVVRRVALKIIKAGMDTQQVIARFESERQALAMMDHPNIARVLDAGTTDGGRPYFVMELIDGEPITGYCDRERLSVRQRLELFRTICGAVQHAHQKGIVHRDLKPTNVLVTVADGRPSPKVIDFGIAKATAGPLTDRTVVTGLHQMIGTLQYMSPEQTEGSGVDIDTRSDIYALGALLYELLTGSPPLEDRRVQSASLAEVQRLICEHDTEPPSRRLSALQTRRAGAADIAARRGTEPTTLARCLRGDLDCIVMKCLEKDRTRRYATASALAEDVSRYLDHQPVLASPPSKSYRLRKFVRRNRAAVVAGAAGILALWIAAGVSIAFGLSEARQRRQAELSSGRAKAAEAAATARAGELEQVAAFQQEQLSNIDTQTMGMRLRADLLAEARAVAKRSLPEQDVAARIADLEAMLAGSNFTGIAQRALEDTFFRPARAAMAKLFAKQPLVEARLLQALASTQQSLGMLEAASEPQRRALEIRRRELGDEHVDTLTSLHGEGELLRAQGNLAAAEPCLRQALEGYRRVLGDEHRSTLIAIGSMGLLLHAKGDLEGAEAHDRQVLAVRRRVLGDGDADTLLSINNLGAVVLARGKLEEAEACFGEALDGYRRVLGDEHPDTLLLINNMGALLQAEGKATEAETYHREALEKYRRVLGDQHPDTLRSINNVGFNLHDQGRLSEAEPYYREALAQRRLVLGGDHPATLNSLHNLAGLLKDQNRLTEAEPLYREALDKRRRVLSENHPDTLSSIHNMGWLLEGQGKTAEAERYFRDALDGYQRVLGPEHRDTLIALVNLGALLCADGRPQQAFAFMAPAEPAARRAFIGDHAVRLGRMLAMLGRCRAANREFAAAETNLLEAHAVLGGARSATEQDRAKVLTGLVELYDAWQAAEPDPSHSAAASAWRKKLAPAQEKGER
jgi:serine/threonine protein kinase/tetratricopeptide (TPR) repeat protein